MSFEVNRGQSDGQVKYLARGRGYTLFLTSQEAVLSLEKAEASSAKGTGRMTNAVLRMRVLGANANARVEGADPLPGKSNYFVGNDPKNWRTNIPTYAKVRVEDVYPGIDLVYYGNQGQLEYDFVVNPGADPGAIRLALSAPARIDGSGDLVVEANDSEVRWRKPVMYQTASQDRGQGSTEKIIVDGQFTIDTQTEVGFAIGDYDRTKPLVIDPVLVYSTYLGGSGGESANGIAVDGSGSAYVTGDTNSTDFPTANALQGSNGGRGDVFVTKFNPDGSALVYSTYLGGSDTDQGRAIAVDASGSAYVTGGTGSMDFPTVNPVQPTNRSCTFCIGIGPPSNAFVFKLDSTGSALVFSTYLGGFSRDWGNGIAVDSSDSAYVTGFAGSSDFPTANALQPTNHCRGGDPPNSNAFVTKFTPDGSRLVYSTYLGGGGNANSCDAASAIGVDGSGNVYVTGYTNSRDFPITPGAMEPTCLGVAICFAGFVSKLAPDGSALVYSTFLNETPLGGAAIAVDPVGYAYMTGSAGNLNTTPNAFQASPQGEGDAFVLKITPDGSTLVYSTYLGGSARDVGTGIAVDSSGKAFLTGVTCSSDFPTANAIQPTNHGGGDCVSTGPSDAFVTELNPDGSGLVYSTYLGGSAGDTAYAIAVDGSSNAYVAGLTGSGDFPTANPFQATNNTFNGSSYGSTAFVAKIGASAANLTISNSALALTLSGTAIAYTITVFNNGPDTALNLNITDAIPAGTTFGSVAISSGSCTAPAMGGTGTVTCTVPSVGMNSGDTVVETLVVNVTAISGSILDTATVSASTFDPKTADNAATASTSVVGTSAGNLLGFLRRGVSISRSGIDWRSH